MRASRKAIEGRMLRGLGMTEHAREALAAHNQEQKDWWGLCRTCGARRSGSISELIEPCPSCGVGK